MKHRPELQDDFISSAGVPTIPLKTAKKHSFANAFVYAIIASMVIVVMIIGYELIYNIVNGLVASYFIVGVTMSALCAIFGVLIKNKWVFLAGLLATAFCIGFMLSDATFGMSLAGSIMIAVFIYRWYSEKYHYESARWPIFIGVLAFIFGVLLISMKLQLIAAFIIAPALLILTGVMMIWELWHIMRN